MDRLFKPSTLRVEDVNVRIEDGDMEWCCSNIRGAITVFVAGEQCPTSTSTVKSMIQPTTTFKSPSTVKPMIQPTTTFKLTSTVKSMIRPTTTFKSTMPASTTMDAIETSMPASTTVYSMSTESKNMTAGTIITNLEGWVIPTISTLCVVLVLSFGVMLYCAFKKTSIQTTSGPNYQPTASGSATYSTYKPEHNLPSSRGSAEMPPHLHHIRHQKKKNRRRLPW